MNSQFKSVSVLLIIACIAKLTSAQLMGGLSSHPINEDTIEKAQNLIQMAKEQNQNANVQNFIRDVGDMRNNARLVHYTTQVVNGTNYTMIYKLLNDSYACVKIYQALPVYGDEVNYGDEVKMTEFFDGPKEAACNECLHNSGLEDQCVDTTNM